MKRMSIVVVNKRHLHHWLVKLDKNVLNNCIKMVYEAVATTTIIPTKKYVSAKAAAAAAVTTKVAEAAAAPISIITTKCNEIITVEVVASPEAVVTPNVSVIINNYYKNIFNNNNKKSTTIIILLYYINKLIIIINNKKKMINNENLLINNNLSNSSSSLSISSSNSSGNNLCESVLLNIKNINTIDDVMYNCGNNSCNYNNSSNSNSNSSNSSNNINYGVNDLTLWNNDHLHNVSELIIDTENQLKNNVDDDDDDDVDNVVVGGGDGNGIHGNDDDNNKSGNEHNVVCCKTSLKQVQQPQQAAVQQLNNCKNNIIVDLNTDNNPSASASDNDDEEEDDDDDEPFDEKSYEDALTALNNLQSNAAVIQQTIHHPNECKHIQDTIKYLLRTGINLNDLEKLSIIHVSGTKGKGSTCALTESILRSLGYKTGFFSSPHLITPNERIRLGGKPITNKLFAKYFWLVYNLLDKCKEDDDDMPAFFKFLNIMSIHVFMNENIDVAIYEVGIGGEYDSTNIFSNTKTIGITSLGLEHTKILGDTLEKIAWQKAGIIKENANVFTVQQQAKCIDVIQRRADEKGATLTIVPDFDTYKWLKPFYINTNNKVFKVNASLAIQLSLDWLNKANNLIKYKLLFDNNVNTINYININEEIINGLEKCFWPGRCQLIEMFNKRIFLDGAHTMESIDVCIDWFNKTSTSKQKLLIFNTTGDRNSEKMLKMLYERIDFNLVIFVPNLINNINNYDKESNEQLERCEMHKKIWLDIQNLSNNKLNHNHNYNNKINAKIYTCINDIFNDLDNNNRTYNYDILVTGSLHLVGAVLKYCNDNNK